MDNYIVPTYNSPAASIRYSTFLHSLSSTAVQCGCAQLNSCYSPSKMQMQFSGKQSDLGYVNKRDYIKEFVFDWLLYLLNILV